MPIYHPQFPLWKTNQTLKWEGVWRELGCLARTASFAVREESGHSLKSSLSVIVSNFKLDILLYFMTSSVRDILCLRQAFKSIFHKNDNNMWRQLMVDLNYFE